LFIQKQPEGVVSLRTAPIANDALHAVQHTLGRYGLHLPDTSAPLSQRSPDGIKWNPGNKCYKSRIALRFIQDALVDR